MVGFWPQDRAQLLTMVLALVLAASASWWALRRVALPTWPATFALEYVVWERDRVLALAKGTATLQAALARDRLGEFQAQAAIAALHADAPTAEETDWV